MLQEDVQWAIDTISSRKLYKGGLEGHKLSEEREEIRAWSDLIYLRNVPRKRAEDPRYAEELTSGNSSALAYKRR